MDAGMEPPIRAGKARPWQRTDPCSNASSDRERVEKLHPGTGEIMTIARHHRQVMQHRDSSDLLVNGILRMGNPETPPHLGSFSIEIKNPVSKVLQHLSKPGLQQTGLRLIAPMPNQINTASQLTDRDR